MDRRTFLRLGTAGLAVPTLGSLLAACGGDDEEPRARPGTSSPGETPLAEVAPGAAPGLQVNNAEAELLVGAGRLALGLVDPQNKPVLDADVTIYAGTNADEPPKLEARATWVDEDHIRDKGVYVSNISFPTAGAWLVAVVARTREGASVKGGTTLTVAASSPSPVAGQPAISVATPTTARPLYAAPLCSRRPVCSMHSISLDDALRSGRPTVVTFATPAFCTSEMCGPVVDIVEDVVTKHRSTLNALHVEPFLNPERGLTKLTPPMESYKFRTEPWTYFIKPDGVVADRIAGVFSTAEADTLVRKLVG